jgi:hypothetical protein
VNGEPKYGIWQVGWQIGLSLGANDLGAGLKIRRLGVRFLVVLIGSVATEWRDNPWFTKSIVPADPSFVEMAMLDDPLLREARTDQSAIPFSLHARQE